MVAGTGVICCRTIVMRREIQKKKLRYIVKVNEVGTYLESFTRLTNSCSILRSIIRSFWFLCNVWMINCCRSTPLLSVYSIDESEGANSINQSKREQII